MSNTYRQVESAQFRGIIFVRNEEGNYFFPCMPQIKMLTEAKDSSVKTTTSRFLKKYFPERNFPNIATNPARSELVCKFTSSKTGRLVLAFSLKGLEFLKDKLCGPKVVNNHHKLDAVIQHFTVLSEDARSEVQDREVPRVEAEQHDQDVDQDDADQMSPEIERPMADPQDDVIPDADNQDDEEDIINNGTGVLDELARQNEKNRNRSEHYEHMSFVLRGQMGAAQRQANAPTKKRNEELEKLSDRP